MQMGVDTRPTSPPPPVFEPEDMVAIEPPCHPQELSTANLKSPLVAN
jgi:hypothetical protein